MVKQLPVLTGSALKGRALTTLIALVSGVGELRFVVTRCSTAFDEIVLVVKAFTLFGYDQGANFLPISHYWQTFCPAPLLIHTARQRIRALIPTFKVPLPL
jgi:hypothetical protein